VLLGTDLGFGEKSRELHTGRLKLNYAKPPLRNSLDYLFTYGRTDGELSANRMDGQTKTDYDMNRKTYLYFLGGAGYDEIRKIDWRYEVGPGAGYHLLKLTNFVLRLEGGFHFQVQNLEGNQQNDIFYYRLAQDLRWNLGAQFTFDEKAEYLPEWNDPQVYRLRVEANLRYWLRSNLSLNFTVINLYDTVTAKGVGQNDLQLRSSVGLKF
jgi:putative salt-induced outer membrane protein